MLFEEPKFDRWTDEDEKTARTASRWNLAAGIICILSLPVGAVAGLGWALAPIGVAFVCHAIATSKAMSTVDQYKDMADAMFPDDDDDKTPPSKQSINKECKVSFKSAQYDKNKNRLTIKGKIDIKGIDY